MSRFVRQSKFRHVFGTQAKRDESYDQIKVTRSAWDTDKVSASTEYWGCIWEAGGGGAFVAKKHSDTGKGTANPPKVAGHKASILDIKFSPFNPYIVASASEDCMVKIWALPEDGLKEDMIEEAQLCKGHKRKVGGLAWHPTASNVLASTSTDYLVKLWDVEVGETKSEIKGHSNIIQSINWSEDGSQMISSSKDKKLRLFDPRQQDTVAEWKSHDGIKGARVLFAPNAGNDNNRAISVGFSKTSDRQYYVWDLKKTDKPIAKKNIDTSSGMLMPFFDKDSQVLFVAGKGDGNIRYYELTDDDKYIYFLSEFKSGDPQKGMTLCPKRMVDVQHCEVAKFLKVTSKNMVVPIHMTVPRKSELFQDDIFPDCYAGVATNTAEGYFGGKDTAPELVSMEFEEGALKKSTAPVETNFQKKAPEKELTAKEIKEEWEALKKRVSFLEAELVKRDATIKELKA